MSDDRHIGEPPPWPFVSGRRARRIPDGGGIIVAVAVSLSAWALAAAWVTWIGPRLAQWIYG